MPSLPCHPPPRSAQRLTAAPSLRDVRARLPCGQAATWFTSSSSSRASRPPTSPQRHGTPRHAPSRARALERCPANRAPRAARRARAHALRLAASPPAPPVLGRQAALDGALNRNWFKESEISRKREVMREKIMRLRDRDEHARAEAESNAATGAAARARRPRS